MKKEKLLLIDGFSILSRAFYGIPDLNNSQGLHTNAIYGFLNIMFKLLEEEQADHLAVAFDLKEPTFRHRMFEGYKGTRKPMPQELHEQVPVLKEVLAAMHIPMLSLAGYEADDILGTIAKRCQSELCEVSIISGDRDLLQLADEHIQIRIPKTNRSGTEIYNYYPEQLREEYGVSPQEFIEMKALMGDASDNIPGVPGIGEKTAAALIQQYHSIEAAYERVDELKPPRASKNLREYWEQAKLSKTLATICTEVPIEFHYEDARVEDLYNTQVLDWLRRLEFKSLIQRFERLRARQQAEGESGAAPDEGAAGELLRAASKAKRVDDPYMARIVFKDARTAGRAGFCLFDGEAGPELAFALSMERQYVFYGFDALSLLREAASEGLCLWSLHVKESLHRLFARESAESEAQWAALRRRGGLQDAALAAYLLNPLKDSYDYEDIARDYLGSPLPDRAELKDERLAASLTALCALSAGPALERALADSGMAKLYAQIELPLVYTLFAMEQRGVCVDLAALRQYAAELKRQIDALVTEIYELSGEQFNLNSPQQLGRILFEKMGLSGGKKTKTGYSTAADVLQKLAEEHPFVARILDYRTLSKLYSTYAEGLQAYVGEDGRIHGQFNQMVTATGRISSTEPNLQNIPVRTELGRELRRVFVPREGWCFIDADYSQVELRILASLSGDERLIAAYRHADDIHTVTASQVFHVPMEQVDASLRRKAKAVNFGIVYGISAFGLSEGLNISRKEANAYIEQYFATYPGVKQYLDEQVAEARRLGYVTTAYGRRRPVPELSSSNYMQRSFGERVAMNSPIQGTAADIMKRAMNAVSEELLARSLKARIVLQVHDELLLELPREELAEVEALLLEKMQGAAELAVELLAEAGSGLNWLEAH